MHDSGRRLRYGSGNRRAVRRHYRRRDGAGSADPADPSDVLGSKKRSVGQAKELQKRFAERFASLRCADLLQKKFVPDDTTPAAKALGLTGHCDIMIATAVELVEQMLTERENG